MRLLFFLAACDLLAPGPDPKVHDTGAASSSTPAPVQVNILAALSACTVDGLWTYEAWTDGPIDHATVDAWAVRPDGWNEAHVIDVVRSSDLGSDLFLQLESGVPAGDYVSGANTPLVCGTDDWAGDLVYVLRVYDSLGVMADCVGWGGDVHAVLDDPQGTRGTVPARNPVDRADEISLRTCLVIG